MQRDRESRRRQMGDLGCTYWVPCQGKSINPLTWCFFSFHAEGKSVAETYKKCEVGFCRCCLWLHVGAEYMCTLFEVLNSLWSYHTALYFIWLTCNAFHNSILICLSSLSLLMISACVLSWIVEGINPYLTWFQMKLHLSVLLPQVAPNASYTRLGLSKALVRSKCRN